MKWHRRASELATAKLYSSTQEDNRIICLPWNRCITGNVYQLRTVKWPLQSLAEQFFFFSHPGVHSGGIDQPDPCRGSACNEGRADPIRCNSGRHSTRHGSKDGMLRVVMPGTLLTATVHYTGKEILPTQYRALSRPRCTRYERSTVLHHSARFHVYNR